MGVDRATGSSDENWTRNSIGCGCSSSAAMTARDDSPRHSAQPSFGLFETLVRVACDPNLRTRPAGVTGFPGILEPPVTPEWKSAIRTGDVGQLDALVRNGA